MFFSPGPTRAQAANRVGSISCWKAYFMNGDLEMNMDILRDCTLCPRNCHANRAGGSRGACGENDQLRVARASLHMWEEPCISGKSGSGTVFFSGCPLGCLYCQNYSISKSGAGNRISVERLSDIFIELQKKNANNINLVTPTHFVLHIIQAIQSARRKGLVIPVVYNTSGYEKVETLKLLDGFIDVYLPDFKYFSSEIAVKYSRAPDYFQYAAGAIAEMVRQTGKPRFDENGIMTKGVLVRHLVLPGCTGDSMRIIEYLHRCYGDDIYLSIMNQYTPVASVKEYPELDRKICEDEYNEVVDYAISLGVENGFIQEGETSLESFIPEFDGFGV